MWKLKKTLILHRKYKLLVLIKLRINNRVQRNEPLVPLRGTDYMKWSAVNINTLLELKPFSSFWTLIYPMKPESSGNSRSCVAGLRKHRRSERDRTDISSFTGNLHVIIMQMSRGLNLHTDSHIRWLLYYDVMLCFYEKIIIGCFLTYLTQNERMSFLSDYISKIIV